MVGDENKPLTMKKTLHQKTDTQGMTTMMPTDRDSESPNSKNNQQHHNMMTNRQLYEDKSNNKNVLNTNRTTGSLEGGDYDNKNNFGY